jgi:hypothetical protein
VDANWCTWSKSLGNRWLKITNDEGAKAAASLNKKGISWSCLEVNIHSKHSSIATYLATGAYDTFLHKVHTLCIKNIPNLHILKVN